MPEVSTLFLWTLACAVGAFILTFFVRRYAINRNIIDCPNERSSHETPTPRGGGVALVVVSLLAIVSLTESDSALWSMALGCAIVAAVGFIDDKKDVSPKLRLSFHFLAATIVAYGAGGLPPLNFFGFEIAFGFIGTAVAIIGLVWLLNLYNFMDGINGIASMEAITTLIPMFLLLTLFAGQGLPLGQAHILVAAAVVGFLLWNFPRARIFMGDAGSGFLGLMLGGLMLFTSNLGQEWLWAWLIMLGVFVVDATLTLSRRALNGARVFDAHRTHAYQWASRIHNSHTKVTLSVGAINLFWLFPLAAMVVSGLVDGFLMLLVAYLPLTLTALKYRAGVAE